MKPLVVVILGCVPLALLTVWSFVELGSIDDRPALPEVTDRIAPQEAMLADVRARLAVEKALADRLVEIEPFSGKAIPKMAKIPSESRLWPVAETWRRWTETQGLVKRFLETERAAVASDNDRIQEAIEELEALKKRCETPGGHARLVELVDRQIAAIEGRLEERRQQGEAQALLNEARQAFLDHRYEECLTLCDRWLSQYATVTDSSVTEKMRILRQRAEFWGDHRQLGRLLTSADRMPERQGLLESFLRKYPDGPSRTAAEREVLQQRKTDLGKVKAWLADQQQGRVAAKLVAQLERQGTLDFRARLRRAAEIFARYPAESTRQLLAVRVDRWLREALPEKELDEPLLLQEAETIRHEIVRGFFKTVKTPVGTIVGYKPYPTYEEWANPTRKVAMIDDAAFLRGPEKSLPRRLVIQYNEARRQLLAEAGRPDRWEQFAELCEGLQRQLQQYRAKPGSNYQNLSFLREGQFAREMLASGCDLLAKILGPQQKGD